MQKVLTENIWETVSRIANAYPKKIAVAYVTDLGLLRLTRGDVLICDASDGNVTAGVVDRDLLAKLFRKGVDIYSMPSLHAKCARFGRGKKYTLIGSSNLSLNSANELEELAIMTDDVITGSKVDARMQGWMENGVEVKAKVLRHLMKLPRTKRHFAVGGNRGNIRGGGAKHIHKHTGRDESKVWVLGTEYSDLTEEDKRHFGKIKDMAERSRDKFKVKQRSALVELKWETPSAFMRDGKPGDFVIDITGKTVSFNVILSAERKRSVGYFYEAPVNGVRSRSLSEFNRALGLTSKTSPYHDRCYRPLRKDFYSRLSRLWKNVEMV